MAAALSPAAGEEVGSSSLREKNDVFVRRLDSG